MERPLCKDCNASDIIEGTCLNSRSGMCVMFKYVHVRMWLWVGVFMYHNDTCIGYFLGISILCKTAFVGTFS